MVNGHNNTIPTPEPKTQKYGQAITRADRQGIVTEELRQLDVYNIKVLSIDGYEFELGDISDNGSVDKHTYNLNHVSYGLIDDYAPSSSRMEYAYYQGNRTVDMPTLGTARYAGRLAVTCNQCDNEYHAGTSSFNVDFANKSLTGSLSALGVTLPVTGKIEGSAFKGEHESTRIEGAFFGDNAQEMAGLFYHESNGLEAGGAFGATKR